MKKRLLIICSIIGVLLAGFKFPIYAETTPPDYSSSTSIMSSTPLDQYFYDNYDLLPYIESDGNQYIDTGILATNNLRIDCKASNILNFDDDVDSYFYFGVIKSNNSLRIRFVKSYNLYRLSFGSGTQEYYDNFNEFSVINFTLDQNKAYVNGSLIHTFEESEFNLPNIYIFAQNYDGSLTEYLSSFRLYNFKIYDYAANNGEGALVRDYYPARAKSSGIIGLYDAVNKTFVTTSGSVPFDTPTGDPVNLSLGANVTQFLSGSLSWIGAIFEGINEMPIIWVFIAIALAGVAFRWARRIVHF